MEKYNKGITLIALVITIIFLLILAGISIAMLTGENGILTKAGDAKDETAKASAREKLQVEVLGSYGTDGRLSLSDLKTNITNHIPGATIVGDTFPITVTVDEQTFTVDDKGNVALAGSNSTSALQASDIAKNPTLFYGAEVRGYAVNETASEAVKSAVTTWRIFYAGKEPNGTEDNIYLIADDYIPYTAAPDGRNGSKIYKNTTDYSLSFNDVYNDYEGSSWILGQTEGEENSLAKGWLHKYFNYTADSGVTYPNRTSTNENIKAVAYMLDTKIWNSYAGEEAKYAIGGPPIEMYCTSYKESHPTSSISCEVTETNGYIWSNSGVLASDCNKIYIKPETDRADAMWLATPSYTFTSHIVRANYNGNLGSNYFSYSSNNPSLCPLVCLKSGVQLEKVSDGVYAIKP